MFLYYYYLKKYLNLFVRETKELFDIEKHGLKPFGLKELEYGGVFAITNNFFENLMEGKYPTTSSVRVPTVPVNLPPSRFNKY